MKEETNDTENTWTPTEAEMNDMYRNARLDFYADAQEAKQEVNRRYGQMVQRFGSYRQMPEAVKEIVKEDYAAHEVKWGEDGTEMQKRFGPKDPEPAQDMPPLIEEKEQFLQKLQQQRQEQQHHSFEYER